MTVLSFLALPHTRLRPHVHISSGLREIDWTGVILHTSILVLFDAACIFSGATLPWSSAGVIALWVLTAAMAILFAVQQRFSVFTEPARHILPIAVLSTRTGFLVMLYTCWAVAGYAIALYYLPLFYAFTRGDDSLETAVHVLPLIGVYIAGAIGMGMILPVISRHAPLYLVGGALITAGAGAMQSVNETTSPSQTMGISAVLGLGVGLTWQLGASVLALALPPAIRMGSGITMTVTLDTGTTVALAIAGCIHQNIGFNLLSEALRGENLFIAQIREALAGVGSPVLATLSPQALQAAVAAVTSATIRIFYIPTAAGVLMIVCSLVMKLEALDCKKPKKTGL